MIITRSYVSKSITAVQAVTELFSNSNDQSTYHFCAHFKILWIAHIKCLQSKYCWA